jgi:transcription initiation factor TFIIB
MSRKTVQGKKLVMKTTLNQYIPDDSIWEAFKTFEKDDGAQCDSKSSIDGNQNGENSKLCLFCKSSRIILQEGDNVCEECGTIAERFIDSTAEWRYYGYEDNKSSDPTRCGMPTNDLLPDSSLGTMIGMKGGQCYEMRILRNYQMWHSMTYKERTLYNIFDNMTVNAVNSGIPATIIDEAKALYKKFSELKLSRGDNRSGLIATAIYMSCKTHNVPRSAKEIAKMFNIKPTTMTKSCKKFQEVLHMELASTTPLDFVQRFCSRINLDREVREMCVQVIGKVCEMSIISENTPPSIAAACIYMVCQVMKVEVDKKVLAGVCDISMVTVSKCFKKLWNYRGYVFTDEQKEKYKID